MNCFKTCMAASLLAPAIALAATGERPAVHEVRSAAESVASLDLPPMFLPAANPEASSAPVADDAGSLPDLPHVATPAPLRFQASKLDRPEEPRENRFSVVPAASTSMRSVMQSTPLAGPARYIHAQRFNTDDGSSMDSFAICYRLNGRSSLQVIPGDPAPVKIPVTTMANNMGVTVGMVLRLSKTR